MHIPTLAIFRLRPFVPGLLIGLFICLGTGCGDSKTRTQNEPTARELELQKTVDALRVQLAAAEEAIEQAKAETALAVEPLPNTVAANPAKSATSTDAAAPTANTVRDTTYVVIKKTFTAGQLLAKPTPSLPNATERRPASHQVTFMGVQSGKEYPALTVTESAYSLFKEGVAYSPRDLNLAKKTDAAKTGTGPNQSAPIDTEALTQDQLRSIFGD